PQIPPDLARVLDDAVAHQDVDGVPVLLPALETPRQPGARQLLVGREAVALEAGILALGERRGGGEHQQVRQEIARLVHEIDSELVVLDADVHVHAADDEAAAHSGEVAGDGLIAVALGGLLRAPAREGMRGGGDGCQPVTGGKLGHRAPRLRQLLPGGARTSMHRRPHLDLRLEEFARHLSPQRPLAVVEQGLGHLAHQIPARPVDEQVLLFDADGEGRVLEGHGAHGGREPRGVQTGSARNAPRIMPWRQADWAASARRGGRGRCLPGGSSRRAGAPPPRPGSAPGRCRARSRSCAGMPGPRSATVISTASPARVSETVTFGRSPPAVADCRAEAAEYLMALSTRLATAWLTSSRLTFTVRPGAADTSSVRPASSATGS